MKQTQNFVFIMNKEYSRNSHRYQTTIDWLISILFLSFKQWMFVPEIKCVFICKCQMKLIPWSYEYTEHWIPIAKCVIKTGKFSKSLEKKVRIQSIINNSNHESPTADSRYTNKFTIQTTHWEKEYGTLLSFTRFHRNLLVDYTATESHRLVLGWCADSWLTNQRKKWNYSVWMFCESESYFSHSFQYNTVSTVSVVIQLVYEQMNDFSTLKL